MEIATPSMKSAFLYNEKFSSVSYGPSHPMRPARLGLTFELVKALGLDGVEGASVVEARRATDDEILLFHTPRYLRVLKEADSGRLPPEGPRYGLGPGDNPVFAGVFEWSSYTTGASVQAAALVAGEKVRRAFNIAGGLHHAMPDRASGFCYINDPVVAIRSIRGGGKRVAYIDIDAHHGDGVQYAFYSSRDVLTVSLHESGRFLFPGTGFVHETGEGEGRGFSVNLPLPPSTDDATYWKAFEAVVPSVLDVFGPDMIVTQLGVDTFAGDPITHMRLTTRSFEKILKFFASLDLPWVALGGGGYNMGNVARAWTIAWAIISGADVPVEIPEDFLERHPGIFSSPGLVDEVRAEGGPEPALREEMERDIEYIKEKIVPLIEKGRQGPG